MSEPIVSAPTALKVRAQERQQRNGHPGIIVWFTGLSGAGKSTLAQALERELFTQGRQVCALDGDELRMGLNAGLGFTREARAENIRRVSEVAAVLSSAGMVAIAACISPYREDRRKARAVAARVGVPFVEVYVAAPLKVCEGRDVKGLYKRARAGELADFTGINAPYEAPERAEVIVHTESQTVAESVAQVTAVLSQYWP